MTVKKLASNKQIIVSNQINEARFKMTKAEQKLFLYCVGIVDNKENNLSTSFEINIKDFITFLELKRKDFYSEMIQITRDMTSRVIEFFDENGDLTQMSILSMVKYKKGNVLVKVNQELAPFLIDLKSKFTRYSLQEILTFKSVYSIRLYQLLSQFNYKNEITYTIERLKFLLNINETEYVRFNDFKKDVLERAYKEINQNSTISFSYQECKTGRKITSITFKINKATAKLDTNLSIEKSVKNEFTQEQKLILQEFLSIGVSEKRSLELIANHPHSFLCSKLDLTLQLLKEGKIKTSPAGFLVKAIEEDYVTQEDVQQKLREMLEQEESEKRKENPEIHYLDPSLFNTEKDFLEEKEKLLKDYYRPVWGETDYKLAQQKWQQKPKPKTTPKLEEEYLPSAIKFNFARA